MAGALELERAVILEEASRPDEAAELLSAIGEFHEGFDYVRPHWGSPMFTQQNLKRMAKTSRQ